MTCQAEANDTQQVSNQSLVLRGFGRVQEARKARQRQSCRRKCLDSAERYESEGPIPTLGGNIL